MEQKITFRPLNLKDVEDIWNLFEILKGEASEVSFSEVESKEEIKSWVGSKSNLTYVAEENNKILAVVKGKRSEEEDRSHAAFLTAATHPEARGKGIAAQLTNYSLDKMKEEGVSIARIYVYSNNKSSLGAVKKLGFTLGGTVLMHHKDPKTGKYVDDVIFHKIL